MGEAEKRKHQKNRSTGTNKQGVKRRKNSRARRRRALRRRRILFVAAAAAVIALLVLAGVLAVRNTRKRKAEEEAAKALATDVADMPFSAAAPVEETNSGSDSEEQADALANGEEAEEPSTPVAVSGIDAFALYRYDEASGMRVRCARYESAWTQGEDIVSLEAFAADTENIVLSAGGGRAWYDAWRAYWQQETGSENCRIGYDISFALTSGEQIHAVLRKPGDELFYRAYLENYLYDDAANADAGWYSHLEPDDLSDTMLLTSIKFTPGERFQEIADSITVTGFVYDSVDDFDYDGNYIGDCFFTTELLNR